MSRILFFLVFFPTLAFSYQIAFIKESRALIYADPEMKVPIGYLSKGKKIKIGEVKRNNDSVVPMVLSGKIVYIKVDDLVIKGEKPNAESTATRTHLLEEEKEEKEPMEPFRLAANVGFMDAGSQWKDLMSLTGGPTSPLIQIEAMVEVRLTQSRFFFDGGFIYSSVQGGIYHFEGLGFKALAQYKLLEMDFLSVDLNAGFNIAPGGAKLIYNGLFDNGSYYGYIFGGQVRLLPKSNLNINIGLDYNIMALDDISDIPLSSGYYKLNLLKGLSLYLGISFPL